jgi:dTDP-4-amino-4,6-dideoxygalactose transaminase
MRKPLYVTRPTLPPFEEIVPLLQEIWGSRTLTNGGPFHQRFEIELARHLGVPYVTLVTNATIGLMVALRQLHVTGDVITTPFSFVATGHSVLWHGATPVFADIDPTTLNLDPNQIERLITPRTSAILAVHCYGRPCDVAAIGAIAKKHKLKVLYDAAHAFAVRHDGQSVLNYGDLSVLSFHATKIFNTFEGGAIIAPNLETKQSLDRLCNYGIVDEVTVEDTGLNAKMSEFNAALGLLQLRHVDEAIRKRRSVDTRYRELLAGIPGIRCAIEHVDPESHNFYSFPILVGPEYPLSRDALYSRLREHGIHARRYFFPLISNLPMYQGLASAAASSLPVANSIASTVLCLPMFPDLLTEEQENIAALIRRP